MAEEVETNSIMAEEEEVLKGLVIQSLENNGVLAKIRAQLRASVFLALDEANTLEKKKPLANTELQNYLATKNGQIVACLVREFLQYFNLDSTLSVYESESYYEQLYSNKDRHTLCRDLGLNLKEVSKGPIVDAVATKQLGQGDVSTLEPTAKVDVSATTPAAEESKPAKPSSLNLAPLPTTPFSTEVEETERDDFFDDPDPNEGDTRIGKIPEVGSFFGMQGSGILDAKISAAEEKLVAPLPTTSGFQDSTYTLSPLASLKDAPSLVDPKGSSKLPQLWSNNKQPPFKTASTQDDDYEEDFQSSASVRSDMKSGTEHSIEEDIEENFSGVVDDLLSNEGASEADDVTTDHTISNLSAGGADYLESVG